VLFNVRLFNSLRQEWARKRLDFDPLWAAGLCLDFKERAYAELDRLGAAKLAATWYGPAA
jgi:hypothetical protein